MIAKNGVKNNRTQKEIQEWKEKQRKEEKVKFQPGYPLSAFCYYHDAPLDYVEKKPGTIIVTTDSEKGNGVKQFYVAESYDSFWKCVRNKEIQGIENNFYEYLLDNRPRKFGFDIEYEPYEGLTDDGKMRFKILVELLLDIIVEQFRVDYPDFNKSKIIVTSSHSAKKLSHHVVIKNYWSRYTECSHFYKYCMLIIKEKLIERGITEDYNKYIGFALNGSPSEKPIIDPNVYSSKQNMRVLGSTKRGANRPQILCTDYKTYDPSIIPVTNRDFVELKKCVWAGKQYKRELSEDDRKQLFFESLWGYVGDDSERDDFFVDKFTDLYYEKSKSMNSGSSNFVSPVELRGSATAEGTKLKSNKKLQPNEIFKRSAQSEQKQKIEVKGTYDSSFLDISRLEEAVDRLSMERSDKRKSWVKIGLALFSALSEDEQKNKELLRLWHKFSSKSSKYEESDCERTWYSFKQKIDGRGVSLGFLFFKANKDNPLPKFVRSSARPSQRKIYKSEEEYYQHQQSKKLQRENVKNAIKFSNFTATKPAVVDWEEVIKINIPSQVKDPSNPVGEGTEKAEEIKQTKTIDELLNELTPEEKDKLRNDLNFRNYFTTSVRATDQDIKWPDFCDVHSYEDRYLRSFPTDKRVIACKSPMNTGKTKQEVDWLNKILDKNPAYTVTVLSPRRSFTKDVQKRLNETGRNFVSYQDSVNTEFLIIQVESLHRDDNNNIRRNIVIIDECSAVLNQFTTDFHRNNLTKNQQVFERYIKDCEYCLILDADLDEHCVRRIHGLIPNEKIHLIHNKIKIRADYNLFLYKKSNKFQKSHWFFELDKAVNAGKSIALATSSKIFGKKIQKRYPELSEKCLQVNGESCDQNIGDLNESTKGVQLFIYTTTLSVGVDICNDNFDVMFAYITSNSACARDVNQMFHRVRFLKDKSVHIMYEQANTGSAVYREFLHEDRYIKWYEDLIAEDHNKLAKSIRKLYCGEKIPVLAFSKESNPRDISKYELKFPGDIWAYNSVKNFCEKMRSKYNILNEIYPLLVRSGYSIYFSSGTFSVEDDLDLLSEASKAATTTTPVTPPENKSEDEKKPEEDIKNDNSDNVQEIPLTSADVIHNYFYDRQQEHMEKYSQNVKKSEKETATKVKVEIQTNFVNSKVMDDRSYQDAQNRIRKNQENQEDKLNVRKTELVKRFGVDEEIINKIHDKASLQNHIKNTAIFYRYDPANWVIIDSYNKDVDNAHRLILLKCHSIQKILSLLGLENLFDDQTPVTFVHLESPEVVDYFKDNFVKLCGYFQIEFFKDENDKQEFLKLPIHQQHSIIIHKIFNKFCGFNFNKPYSSRKKQYHLKPFSNPLKETRPKKPTVEQKRLYDHADKELVLKFVKSYKLNSSLEETQKIYARNHATVNSHNA
jgi:hypothetical protein